ncbi:MAG: phospholipase D-like domain-containing protein [Steroidobacteraceae bacterium]
MLASESTPDASGSHGVGAFRAPRRRRLRLLIAGGAVLAWLGTAWWHTHKPLPPGERVAGRWYAAGPLQVRFIADVTAADAYGRPAVSHAAFDEMLRIVQSAREFVVIDAPRFTSGASLAARLADALIARKQAQPGLRVLFIVDPVDVAPEGVPPDLARLQGDGIDVIAADLDPLRDSNYLYSSLWRLSARWWLSRSSAVGASLAAANLKADRRNLVIGDDGEGSLAGVLSATELSSAGRADSNVAIRLAGPALVPLLASEIRIARSSGWSGVLGIPTVAEDARPAQAADPGLETRVLTEGAIRDALLRRIGAAGAAETVDIAAFYLSERAVIEALIAASRRGAAVRLILDPGEDAFGRSGAGIPNRSVAGELLAASDGAIQVRWYRTHGERYHASLAMIYGPRQLWLTVGSANFTRRSLDDYDLDANAAVVAPRDSAVAAQALDYFATLWSNKAGLGIEYTADVGVYADPSQLHYWRYRLMEATGLAMF